MLKKLIYLIIVIFLGFNIVSADEDGFATRGKRLPWTTGEKWNHTSGYLEDFHVIPPTQYKLDFAKRFNDLSPNQPGTYNQPVLAIGDGVVEKVETVDTWPSYWPKQSPNETTYQALGKFVVIDNGGGYYTQYDHLLTTGVTVGQQVYSGYQIGRSGNSGFSIGYHIQVSLWKDGWQFSDPPGTPIPLETAKSVFGKDLNSSISPITSFFNTTKHFYLAEDPTNIPPPPPKYVPTEKEARD